MKKTCKTRKILAVILAFSIVLTMSVVSFAAADPTKNVLIHSLSDSAAFNSSTVRTTGMSSGTRTTVNFTTIDANDTTHGDVLRYTYAPGSTMSGVVMYEEVFNYKSPNKKLSFDFYVYDNTIPYEIRLMCCESLISNTKYIGQFNINYTSGKIQTPNINAKIGVMDAGQASGAEKATAEITNKQWHKMEAIITAEEVNYYIDGTFLGTSIVPADNVALAYNSFAGFQVVSRANYQADTVEATKSGLYLDNIKVHTYDENSMFYGTAAVNENEIVVELSESVLASSPLKLSNIMVYNTKTGDEVYIGTPVLKDRATLVIPLNVTLESNCEYLIKMPVDLIGISQKTIHPTLYFVTSSGGNTTKTYFDEHFTEYSDLETGKNNTDVLAAGPQWFPSYINVKDSGDTAHGKVLAAGNAANNSGNSNIRFGVKMGDEVIDVSKGMATVEFDMKIVNPNYSLLYVMPYSTIKDVDDAVLVNSKVDRNQPTNPSHFCGLSFANAKQIKDAASQTGGKAWVQMRVTDSQVVGAQNYPPNGHYKYKLIPVGGWYKMKITIDKSSGTPMVAVYVNDELLYESTADKNFSGSQATDYLRGIRFSMDVPTGASAVTEDYIQIDNVKFTGPASNAAVSKMRMFNVDGEAFGPIATNDLKASADTAEIYFNEAVDTSNATVFLAGGTSDIIGTLSEFDSANKKVTVTFNDVMEKNTTYTLTVTGVKTKSGEAVPDSTASFTTNGEAEFIIADLNIADASGNEIATASDISEGDTVYANVKIINTLDDDKTALVIIAEYNDLAMTNVNYAEYDISTGSKKVVTTEIPITIKSLTNLAVKGFVWEGFSSNKPLTEMVVCD